MLQHDKSSMKQQCQLVNFCYHLKNLNLKPSITVY